MKDCICPHHPALPGIPSDERWDVKECPHHHPELVVAKTLKVRVFIDEEDDFPAAEFYENDIPTGLTSKQFAKDFAFDGFNDYVPTIEVAVDDQDWVEVR